MADETAGASDEGARPTGLSSPRVRLGLLIAGILVLLAGSYWYYNHQTYGRFQQSTDNAYIAADSVIISSKIAGYVERVLVTENQTVASGDALSSWTCEIIVPNEPGRSPDRRVARRSRYGTRPATRAGRGNCPGPCTARSSICTGWSRC